MGVFGHHLMVLYAIWKVHEIFDVVFQRFSNLFLCIVADMVHHQICYTLWLLHNLKGDGWLSAECRELRPDEAVPVKEIALVKLGDSDLGQLLCFHRSTQ